MTTPRFATRDPGQAGFWTERYASGFLPWDQGGVPADVERALNGAGGGVSAVPAPPARVLLPGCGSGYELAALADAGYDALAIDISSAAVDRARAAVGRHADRVQLADCFAFADDLAQRAAYAWVYERAFLCALPPRLWQRWAQAMAALVAPGGVLAGFFYVDADANGAPAEARRGPPFSVRPEELSALLDAFFMRVAAHPVAPPESIPVFRGKEWWTVWRRRTDADGRL